MSREREYIIVRVEPCRCGCGGRDPWHRANYRRVVTKTSETTGTARFPWGVDKIKREERAVVGGRVYYSAWELDKS